MDIHTVLVLSADLADPDLKLLAQLPPETNIVVGNSVEAFERLSADATVIFSWSLAGQLLRDVFAMCPNVRWVHSRSAGLETVLFPALVESPVPLTNGRGVFSQTLGEFALGAILYFAKDFRRMNRNQEAGRWEPFDIVEIAGQTVGILGYGDIGRAVAARARAMGMRVLAVKRRGPSLDDADPLVQQVFPPAGRVEMLAQSDYIVAAAPLTPETRGIIGEPEFAAMKPNAVVINLGRGPVIDEAAMVRALSDGHPFYRLENVLLSPHCADHTPDWTEQAMRFFLAQFERFSEGKPLANVVDRSEEHTSELQSLRHL